MNYVWEIAIHLLEKSVRKDEIFYIQAKEYSPYYEQAFQNINETECNDNIIEINSFYRFDRIFGELLNPNLEGDEEFKQYLFDIIMHYLTETDLMKGLSKRELYIRKIKQDIIKGHYGKYILEQFLKLKSNLQYLLCDHLLIQYQTGSSVLLYSKTVRALFQDAIVYKNNMNKKQLLVYIGVKQSEEIKVKMNVITDMFLPIGYHIRIFYEHHFGIIDVPETLQLDDIEIF